jgi:hypothetical protein
MSVLVLIAQYPTFLVTYHDTINHTSSPIHEHMRYVHTRNAGSGNLLAGAALYHRRFAILTTAKKVDTVSTCVSRYRVPARHLREQKSEPRCENKMDEKVRDTSGKVSAHRCHDNPRIGKNKLAATCLGRTVPLHVYYIQFSLSMEGM